MKIRRVLYNIFHLVAVAIALTLISAGSVRLQACGSVEFQFATGTGQAHKCGYPSWIPDTNGLYHYYLQLEEVDGTSIAYHEIVSPNSYNGSLYSDTIRTTSVPGCVESVIKTNGTAYFYRTLLNSITNITTGYPIDVQDVVPRCIWYTETTSEWNGSFFYNTNSGTAGEGNDWLDQDLFLFFSYYDYTE